MNQGSGVRDQGKTKNQKLKTKNYSLTDFKEIYQ